MNLKKVLGGREPPFIAWMERAYVPLVLALLCLATRCCGQGTMTVTFEGPAFPGATQPQPRGTFSTVTQYSESGMRFSTPYSPWDASLMGGGLSWAPENGTAYLQVPAGAALAFWFSSYVPFSLSSLDLAENTVNPAGPVTVHVVGYTYQGAVVASTDLTTDGVNDGLGPLADFQTFTFDSRFQNLLWVEMSSSAGFSLDNVVISGIPEPSTGSLVLLGAACAFGRSWITGRRPRRNGRQGGPRGVRTRPAQLSR